MVILIIVLFLIPFFILFNEAKSLDKNFSLKSIFSIKSFRKEMSLIKDIIGGEWILSPDRVFYNSLAVNGKYRGRELRCEYQLPSLSGPAYLRLWFKTCIDLSEKPFSEMRGLVETGFFLTKEKYLLIAEIIPLNKFFDPENIKYLLDNLLVVAESVENKDIDKAMSVWKNIPEKCFFREYSESVLQAF